MLTAAILMAVLSQTPAQPEPKPSLTEQQAEALRSLLQLPADSVVELEFTSKDGGSVHIIERGKGVGAGGSTEGGELSESVTGSAPEVGLGQDRNARGGNVARETEAVGFTPPALPWANPLFWLGVVQILAAGALAFLPLPIPKPKSLPMVLAASGAIFITVAFFPTLLLWGVVAGGVFLLFPYVKSGLDADKYKEGLRAVVAGVEDDSLPAQVKDAVKSKILTQMDPADRDTIREIKMKDKLGKFG
jgi:hypothetical protein